VNKKRSSPASLAKTPSVEQLIDGEVALQGKRRVRRPRNAASRSGPNPGKRSIPRPDLRVESNGGVTIFGDGNNGKYLNGEIPDSDRHYAAPSTYTDVIVYHVGNVGDHSGDSMGGAATGNPNRSSRRNGRPQSKG